MAQTLKITYDDKEGDESDEVSISVHGIYDAPKFGDKIVYNYEKRFDRKKVKSEIETLKEKLSDGDYRVIKCYEATLAKIKIPYDIEAIHKERQAIRDKINELELKLSANA